MMIPPPVLQTDRLTLRCWHAADLQPFHALHASAHAALMWGPMTPPEAWKTLLALAGEWLVRGFGMWALGHRDTGTFAGHVGFLQPEDAAEPELGWAVAGEAEGRGLAHEAVLAARHWGRANGIARPVSHIDARNVRSIRLAERLGAVEESRTAYAPDAVALHFRHPGPEAS